MELQDLCMGGMAKTGGAAVLPTLTAYLNQFDQHWSAHGERRPRIAPVAMPRATKLRLGNAQHRGTRREQQDAFGFSDLDDRAFTVHGGVLAALADGMGGMALGREAAQSAIAALLRHYAAKDPVTPPEVALQLAVHAANAAVNQLTHAAGLSQGAAGATLAVVVAHEARLYWAAVGDSRIYLYRHGELAQLNLEHIFARELWRGVATGHVDRPELWDHPEREMLTSYLGLPELPELDYNRQPLLLQPGDRLLLCSDGLYQMLAAEIIAAILPADPQIAAARLVKETLNQQHPHQDNVTAVILACDPDEPVPYHHRRLFGLSVVLLLLFLILAFTTSVRADSTIDDPRLDILMFLPRCGPEFQQDRDHAQ
ncbi:MAG: serine/threonine-protein phosphatase [Gammaproteobacteria bacterium]|nr:serine/threonine-protein phosphatase [Gammaproteobacteria bacterium]